MMAFRTMVFLIFSFNSLLMQSCQRIESKTELNLSLPSFSSLYTGYPVSVAVSNLDGSGVVRVTGMQGQNIQIEIERGTKVIQVFTLYPSELSFMSEGGEPYFGLQTVSLDQEQQTVSVSLQKLSAFVGGDVAGRIVNAANSGPTGKVDLFLKFRSHLPGLKFPFSNYFIANGWFQFFAIYSPDMIGIDYVLENGTSLFGGVKNLSNFSEGGAKIAQLALPFYSRLDGSSSNERDPESFILGYWGEGASSKNVTTDGILDLKKLECPNSGPCAADDTLIVGSTWGATDTTSILSQVTQLTFPAGWNIGHDKYYLRQSNSGGASICAGQWPANCLLMRLDAASEGGKDTFSGFKGIFQAKGFSNENDFLKYRNDLSIKLLPGIQLNQLKVYKLPDSSNDRVDSEEAPSCGDAAELASLGFEYVGDSQPAGLVQIDNTNQQINFSYFPLDFSQLAFCPTLQTTQGLVSYPHAILFDKYELPDPCDLDPAPGTRCDDGSYFIGENYDNDESRNYKYFISTSQVEYIWSSNTNLTGANRNYGLANINILLALSSTLSGYPAAAFCYYDSSHQKNDWFLPSLSEWEHFSNDLNTYSTTLNIDTDNYYWSSTEDDTSSSKTHRVGTVSSTSAKSSTLKVRCFRRE